MEQEQQGDDTPEYGARLLERLSEDLQHKLGKGFSVRNLRKMRRFYLIGIGSPLAEAPSHTTGHAGPHPAIRLIKADHQLSKYNPSDLK